MHNAVRNRKGAILKEDQVVVRSAPVSVPPGDITRPRPRAADTAPGAPDEPELNVIRAADGTIQSIHVRCPCGREISLQCEYVTDGGGEDEQAGPPQTS